MIFLSLVFLICLSFLHFNFILMDLSYFHNNHVNWHRKFYDHMNHFMTRNLSTYISKPKTTYLFMTFKVLREYIRQEAL